MLFVDGENFAIRGREFLEDERKIPLPTESRYFQRDVFLWLPIIPGTQRLQHAEEPVPIQDKPIRSLYYTSVQGDEARLHEVHDSLLNMGFLPRVMKRSKGETKSKGVDIKLCTEMLANAYMDNYDVAFLATGDADFLPVVEEVQRLGKRVHLMTFNNGLNEKLKRACDLYLNCGQTFAELWTAFLTGGEEEVKKIRRI
jgi:uncharacterized LabA/DUF88 family protein